MNSKIKKIDSIKGMAVFQDFNWEKSVRDKDNKVVEFSKINILYGRNYSGKTTLSRIFRALELGSSLDYKDASPEFLLSMDDGKTITQNSFDGHGQLIRVFNRDFVKDNLRFIVDDEQGINSFAILGGGNTEVEDEIVRCEAELGTEDKKTGLVGNFLVAVEKFAAAQKAHTNKDNELNDKLRNMAKGIKLNRDIGDPGYNITTITNDIAIVTKDSYSQLDNKKEREYYAVLDEVTKRKIDKFTPFDLRYSIIVSKAKELIEQKIQMSNPIRELLNNAALEKWVRDGRGLHKGERDKCAFCGNDLPEDLWKKLDRHFNQESEELRTDLDRVLMDVEGEKKRVFNLLKIRNSDFYTKFTKDLDALAKQFSTHCATYCKNLESIKEKLKNRIDCISTPLTFVAPASVEDDLNAIGSSYEELINNSNQYTDSLSAEKSDARSTLLLHVVYTSSININYTNEKKTIKRLKEEVKTAKKLKMYAKADVDRKQAEISKLKDLLNDESKGADRVNDYLNGFFGHQSLHLKAREETTEDTPTGYRFEVIRNDKKAHYLSEGECSLIAFCYFMAKLEDTETKDYQPIIWIDDPVSSLDGNHIFFVYSLIRTAIVKSKKFTQLFISTHNLEFLKYLRRISHDYKGKKPNKIKIREYFLIERSNNSSKLCLMPKYLKDHVTEFNYLFHQIYKCATIESISGRNHYDCYNFGNNARKFLEIYLYYKYPNIGKTYETLQLFFDKNIISASLIDRIINDYSHGNFERGVAPIDGAEMKKAARDILLNIKQKDQDQYSGLLKSIGVKKDPLDDELVTTK